MRKLLYLGLISILILLSCKKRDDYPGFQCGFIGTAYITSSDLQNCKYKTGSYWVFVDSINIMFDSVAVVSFNQGFIEDMCENSYEIHNFITESSYSSKSMDYIVVQGGLFKGFDGNLYSGTLIYDDFNTTTSKSDYIVEKFDSIFIYNQYYKKVLRVEIDNDNTENHNKSLYFINSEFGFLRHDIYTDNILTSKKVLMRKNIIR